MRLYFILTPLVLPIVLPVLVLVALLDHWVPDYTRSGNTTALPYPTACLPLHTTRRFVHLLTSVDYLTPAHYGCHSCQFDPIVPCAAPYHHYLRIL